MQAVAMIVPGAYVASGDRRYRVHRVCDLESVLAIDCESGVTARLAVAEIQLSPAVNTTSNEKDTLPVDLQRISDEDWAVARARFEAIKPLLDGDSNSAEVEGRARTTGISRATLYRWLRTYLQNGTLAALLPTRHGAAAGQKRLPDEIEYVISAALKTRYLSEQRIRPAKIAREVMAECSRLDIPRPHAATVRRRIQRISESVKDQEREGGKAMQRRFSPVIGSFPGADAPLRFVQIDHTPVDLELVDDVHRRPVGRPWITLAIDVFSRVIAGFYISFDPPSALSVGLCLAHAILPKDLWLAKRDIRTPWPVWGIMDAIHCDNAKEFHGSMLAKACENYGIELHFRPVKQPHYGGHIERLLGTFATEIHTLPGTTFSNPAERGTYDSEGKAALTLFEFEKWLATQISEVYHQHPHSELGMSPIHRYQQGIMGSDGKEGRGLPPRCVDEGKLRLDFLPYFERTVQRGGISIDEIHYFSDVLRRWIEARDPQDSTKKRLFIVRRDPRDISVVYFYDPEAQQYFRVPYRDGTRPAISIWELREIRRRLREEGRQHVDEKLIFAAYDRLRAIERQAVATTKATRRKEQRRRMHEAAREASSTLGMATAPALDADELALPSEITPFDEVEIL